MEDLCSGPKCNKVLQGKPANGCSGFCSAQCMVNHFRKMWKAERTDSGRDAVAALAEGCKRNAEADGILVV